VRRALFVAGLLASLAAALPPEPRVNLTHGCVDRFDASVDYFPEKVSTLDAKGFSVEYHHAYKVLTVANAFAGGTAERYVLLQCGAPWPALEGDLARAQVITVPVTSVFAASTTYLPALVDLERLDVLTGVANGDFIDDPAIAARIARGQTIEFARVGLQTDVELIVSAHPSVMIQGGTSPAAIQVRNACVPVFTNT
jgi:iron complex transport system substrate-binding protein